MDKDEKNKATIKIIELYKNHEALWNMHAPSYRRKDLKEKAWKSIAAELDWPEAAIKKKIKALRSTYISEKKKIMKSVRAGGDPQGLYEPNLSWFYSMAFLDSTIIWRKPISNLGAAAKKSSNVTITNENCFDDLETKVAESKSLFHDIKETSESNFEDADTTFEDVTTLENISQLATDLKPDVSVDLPAKRKCSQFDSQTTCKIYRYDDITQKPHDIIKKNERDEKVKQAFNIFGDSIATQLKDLPPEQAYPAMAEIQQILVNKKLTSLRKRKISHNAYTQTQLAPTTRRPALNFISHGTAIAPNRTST